MCKQRPFRSRSKGVTCGLQLKPELAAGNPVLVLQNLGLPIAPKWHYAVAIGYDVERRDIILRSGTTERLVMPLSTFEHTWARSGYWGMVTLSPGRLPGTTTEAVVVDALVAAVGFAIAGVPAVPLLSVMVFVLSLVPVGPPHSHHFGRNGPYQRRNRWDGNPNGP